jgi:hypothetical protein
MRPSCNGASALPHDLAWSADGKRITWITYSLFTLGDVLGTIKSFYVAGKQVEPFACFRNELVLDVVWLPGGQWLLARYQRKGPSYLRAQIGLISRAGGQVG